MLMSSAGWSGDVEGLDMTRINNRRTTLFALALGVSAIAGAHAQGWGGPHGDHHMFGLLDGVTLSDAQKEQVHSDMKAGFAAARTTMQSLHAIDDQITAMMTSSGSVSAASAMALIQQQETLRSQLDQERVAVALQVRSVLTATQLTQAAAAHSQLEALHQQEMAISHPDAGAPPE